MLQQPHHETLNSIPSSFAHEMDNRSVVSGTSSAIDEALDGKLEAFMADAIQEHHATSGHPLLSNTALVGKHQDEDAAAVLFRKKLVSDNSSKGVNSSLSSTANTSSTTMTKLSSGIGIGSHTHSLLFDDNDSTAGSLIFDDSSAVEDQPLSRQQRSSLVSFAAEELAVAEETATNEERRHHSDGTLEINSSAHTNASKPKAKRLRSRSKNPEDVPPGAKSFPVNTPRLVAKFPTNEPRTSKFPKNETRMVKKNSASKGNNISASDPGLSDRRRGRSRPRRKEGGLDASSKSDTAAVKKSTKTKIRMADNSDKTLDKSRRRTKTVDPSDKAVEKKKTRSQSVPAESSDHSRELAEKPQHHQLPEEEPEPHHLRSRNVSAPVVTAPKNPHPTRSRNVSDSSIAVGASSHSNTKHKQHVRKRPSDPDVLGSSTSNSREKRASDSDVLGTSASNRREKRASDPDALGSSSNRREKRASDPDMLRSSTSNRRETRLSDPDMLGPSSSNRREKRLSDPNVLESSSGNRRERDRSTSKRPNKTSLHALEQKKQEHLKQEEQEHQQRQEQYQKDEELLVDFPDIDTHNDLSTADTESLIPDTPAEPPSLKKSSSRMSIFSLGKKKQQTYGKLADDEDEIESSTTREYVKQLVLVEDKSSPTDSPTLSTAASFRKRAASLGVGKKRAKKPSSTNKRSASVSVRSSATKSTTSENKRSASVSAKSRTSSDGITKKITKSGRKLVKKATSKSDAKGPPKIYFPKNEPRGGPKRRWSLTDTAVISSDIENFSGIDDDISVNKKQTALDGIASPTTSRSTLDGDPPELKKTRRSSLKMDKIRARSESIKRRRRSRSKRRSESVTRSPTDGEKYRSHASLSLLSQNYSDDDADHSSMADSHQNLLENISISDIIGSSETSKNILANIAKDKSLALTDRWEHIPIRAPLNDHQSAEDHPGMNGSSSNQSRRKRQPLADGSHATLDGSLREMVPMTPVNQMEGRRDRRMRSQGLAESSHTTRTDLTSMEGSLQSLSIRETRKARREQRLSEYSPGDHSTLDSSREISPNTQSSSQNRRARYGVANHSQGAFNTKAGSPIDLSPAHTRATRKSRGVVERSPGDRFLSDGSSSKKRTSRSKDTQRRSRSASANKYHDDPEANFGDIEPPNIRKVRKARVDKNGETARGRRTRSESTARKKTSPRPAGSSTSREHRRRGHTHDTGVARHHHSSGSLSRTRRRDSTSRSRSRSKNSKSLSSSAQFRLPVEPPLHTADDPHPEVVPKMEEGPGEESDVEDHNEDRSARKKSLSIRHLYGNGQASDGEDSEAGGDFNAPNASSQEQLHSNHTSNSSSLHTSNSSKLNASNGSSLQSSNHSSLHASNSSNLHESNSSSLSNNSSLTLDNLYGLVGGKEDNGADHVGQTSEKPVVKKKSSRKPRDSIRSASLTPMHVSFRDNDSVKEIEDDFRSKDDLDAQQMSKSDVADRARHRDSRRRVLEAGAMAMRDSRRGAGTSKERRHSKDRMAVSEGDHRDDHHHSNGNLDDDIAAVKAASRQPTKAAAALYSNPQQRRRLRTNVGHEMLHASINSSSTMGLEYSPPPPSLNSEKRKEQVWHRRRRKSSEYEEDD